MPTIYTPDELAKDLNKYGGPTTPEQIEAVKKTLINFKSPKIKLFAGVALPGDMQFYPQHIQYFYSDAILTGAHTSLEDNIEFLNNTLRKSIVNAIRGEKYEIAKMEREEGKRYEHGRERLALLTQDMLPEIDYLIPILKQAIPVAKRAFVKVRKEYGASDAGRDDATEKKPMNALYVDLAGTDLDNYAQAYTKAYVATRERVGARRKTKHTTRKTRRVKKLNGRK